MELARSFNKTTISRLRAATGSDAAIGTSRAVGPHDHLAAATIRGGVSGNRGVRAHISRRRILDGRVRSMQVAADQDGATACRAGHIDVRRNQADVVAQQLDCAACARTFGFYRAGHQRGVGFGLNRYRAALLTVGAESASCFEGYVLLRTQDDFAACVPPHLVGIDDAGVPKRRTVNTDLSALCKDLAEVDGGVIVRRDFDPHSRRAGVEDIHRLPCGQDHVALRTVDDAAVADVSANQIDAAARRCGDIALIFHLASKRI